MADFSMYHAMGSGSNSPKWGDGKRSQPSTPSFRHPVAPSPSGYQQTGSSYGNAPPQPHGAPAEQGYFPPQPPPGQGMPNQAQPQGEMGGLTQQMGGMALGQEGAAGMGTVRSKKKDRHAYHQLEQPQGSSQAFNGMPQGNFTPGGASQYLDSGAPQTVGGAYAPSPQFGQQQSPVGMGGAPNAPLTGTPASSSQGRVDPEQIPSIPKSRDGPAQYYLDHVYPTMEKHLPPPAAIPFVAYDQGNSSPKYARLTISNIPSSSDALNSTGLPLGVVLQPLAPQQEGEQPIPVLDFGEVGPPRCRRCRAYINPFMSFRAGGNKFVCNMCTFPNDVAPEYFSPTDPSGIRVDRQQRPELMQGTVEFMVPKEYWAKEPVGIRWLFCIDVSAEAVNKGFLDGFCEGIMGALYGGADETESSEDKPGRLPAGAKVGIVTYDREIHYYNLSANLDQAQMLVMPDVEEPFVPLSEGLFVDPEESKAVITSLLTQLPNMFSQIKNPEPAMLPTLNSALSALAETGGKIVCSLASLPTWGPGRLFLRDDGKLHGTEGEKKLHTTENPLYKKLADSMVEKGVGVDFFLAAPQGGYLDIATIGEYLENGNPIEILIADRPSLVQDWRRDVLLPELPLPTGYPQAVEGDQAHRHSRNWLPGADEGSLLKRSAGICLPRQLHSSHFWSRSRVWSHRCGQGDRRLIYVRWQA
jgi:protein transport protein SEC24